jgi:hypothetical protein
MASFLSSGPTGRNLSVTGPDGSRHNQFQVAFSHFVIVHVYTI